MSSVDKNGFRIWIGRWGFSVLVSLAVLVAACVAWKVEVPSTVPDFALNAAAVYRVEILKMVWRFVKALERTTDASANESRKRLEKLEELQSSELPPH